MRRYLAAVTICAVASGIGVGSALAGGASDTSGDGSHCYLFFSLPNERFAQAMMNDGKPFEVIRKAEEFIEKYEKEGGTLELAVGNVDGTVCAAGTPDGGGPE